MQQNEKVVDEAERPSDGIGMRRAADGDRQRERSAFDGTRETGATGVEPLVGGDLAAPPGRDRPLDVLHHAPSQPYGWQQRPERQLLAGRVEDRGQGPACQP